MKNHGLGHVEFLPSTFNWCGDLVGLRLRSRDLVFSCQHPASGVAGPRRVVRFGWGGLDH